MSTTLGTMVQLLVATALSGNKHKICISVRDSCGNVVIAEGSHLCMAVETAFFTDPGSKKVCADLGIEAVPNPGGE